MTENELHDHANRRAKQLLAWVQLTVVASLLCLVRAILIPCKAVIAMANMTVQETKQLWRERKQTAGPIILADLLLTYTINPISVMLAVLWADTRDLLLEGASGYGSATKQIFADAPASVRENDDSREIKVVSGDHRNLKTKKYRNPR